MKGKKVTTQQLISMIEEQKAVAKAAYEKVDTYTELLFKKLGHGHETVTEITDPETQNKMWKRVRVIDNSEVLKSGKGVYRATGFKRVEIEIDYLKTKPKEKTEG